MNIRANLIAFLKSKTFKALVAVIATALTAYASTGCAGFLASAPSARVAKFNCQVDALQPVFGDVLDTAELLRGLYAGQADLDAALSAAGATETEVRALTDALRACEGPVAAPPAEELTPS